jgi:predicted DNA-binding transcriptional regulator AlpA
MKTAGTEKWKRDETDYPRSPAVNPENNDLTHLKEVMTPDDLAEVLGISVWTIYAKTSKRNRGHVHVDLPPFFRIGKLVRFWRRDLVLWLESRKKIDPNDSSRGRGSE